MVNSIQRIEEIAADNGGVVTAADVRMAGVSPSYLSRMVSEGRLTRLERGLYAEPGVYVDEMFELYSRNRFVVFSHLSALYLHGLSDRTPLKMHITVPREKNISRLLESGLVVARRSNEQTHDLGLIMLESPAGFLVPAFDMERTVCDIVKARRQTDPQVLADALKAYARRKDRDLARLSRYAKTLKVEEPLRPYMEVLL